jgi:predicted PurR-regulated permease PerM
MQRFEVPEIPLRQIVLWTSGALLVSALFLLLVRFNYVVLLLLTAVILSTAISPIVQWLEKRGVAKPVGISLIFAAGILLLGLLVWFALPVFTSQGSELIGKLNEGYTLLLDKLRVLPNIILQRLMVILPDNLLQLVQSTDNLETASEDVTVADMLQQGQLLFRNIFPAIAIILLTIYWTLEGGRIRHAGLMLVPIQKRSDARELVDEISSRLSGYIIGQGILCLIIGVLALIAYTIIGLPNALFLAIFAGIMEAVPVVGPFIGAIPAIIIALTISPISALWVVVATVVIQQLENNLLVPRVMKRAIGVSPLVSILALLALGSMYGILGALVALPLAAIVQLLLGRFVLSADVEPDPLKAGRDRLSLLRYETHQLVQDVRGQVRKKDTVPSELTDFVEDELEAIALDLESYLAGREKVLP